MMKRTPSNAQGKRNAAGLWEELRRRIGELVTVADLHLATGMDRSAIRDRLNAWNAGGYIAVQRPLPPVPNIGCKYSMTKDFGPLAPRVRKDGSQVLLGQGQQRMWVVMRILKSFSATELAVTASTPEHQIADASAKDYCRKLYKAGYLRLGENGRYLLLPSANTGPRAPQVQRSKKVWDVNLQRTMEVRNVTAGA
ncbi:hypothetical protein [Candidatus Electronema sp. JM]|uniref:hypothetical protein n=1 Tax=Candidatus Electronema sp. JM TaxID=3401571 RepID=UPI003AA91750